MLRDHRTEPSPGDRADIDGGLMERQRGRAGARTMVIGEEGRRRWEIDRFPQPDQRTRPDELP